MVKQKRGIKVLVAAMFTLGAVVLSLGVDFGSNKAHATSSQFYGEFWNNPLGPGGQSPSFPGGSPVYTQSSDDINFNWGMGSPNFMVQNEDFIARWTKTDYLAAGTYNFSLAGDDGVRLYIDDEMIIDAWVDQGAGTVHTAQKDIEAGQHTIKVEFYENGAVAEVYFNYSNTTDGDGDGVDNTVEAAGPNGGDANNDGTADTNQANVASFVNSVTGNYSAVEVGAGCTVRTASTLTEPSSNPDIAFEYPMGLINFSAVCDNPGDTTDASLYYFGGDATGKMARKYNSQNQSYQVISNPAITQTTIGGDAVAKISYSITDGGELDEDGAANGTIVDPAGFGSAVLVAPKAGL